MLTKIQNPKIGYLSRIMVLPLAALVFAAFALKPKKTITNAPLVSAARTITVMIDPGHGGTDDGALASNGLKEKDFNLAIAKKIQKLNPYKNIIIMLSREDDKTIGVRERVEFAKKANLDAYISIHANANGPDPKPSGIELYVSRQPQEFAAHTRLLASLVATELSKNYKTDKALRKNENSGVWVLDAPGLTYASLLIECGNLNLPEDLKYFTSDKNQDAIALSILKSINEYASSPVPNGSTTYVDTSAPKKLVKDLKSVEYTIDGNVIVMYKNGKAEKMTPKQAEDKGFIPRATSKIQSDKSLKDVLFIVNGTEMPLGYNIDEIEPSDIKEVQVLKDWEVAAKYGDKAKNGVVVINTKSGKTYPGATIKPELEPTGKTIPDNGFKPRPDANQVKPQ